MSNIYKNRNIFKIILVICLLGYILAMLHIVNNPCALDSIDNCSLNGTLGIAYAIVCLLMVLAGLYGIYIALASLKHGVYSSEKILLLHKTKPVTGKQMYLYCLAFVVGGLSFIVLPIFWWNVLDDTISQYDFLYPDKYIDLKLKLEGPQQNKSEN